MSTESKIEVRRAGPGDFQVAWQLLNEYFEAVHVALRDEPAAVKKYLHSDGFGIWLAMVDGNPAGCIALRELSERAGEVKRLYVRPEFRRLGLAKKLLSALEAFADSTQYQTLYLDSKDDLHEALAFYERAGYVRCERYNDNFQATIFMRKQMAGRVQMRGFQPGDEAAFWSLNEAWISKLFQLEEKDIKTLRDPEKYILSKGGFIFMACRGDERIGCCALLNMGDAKYEVAKMGVAESERGQGVGRAMLEYVVSEARRLGSGRLYLETNHKLANAIHLYEAVGFRHLRPEAVTPSPYARADVFMELVLV